MSEPETPAQPATPKPTVQLPEFSDEFPLDAMLAEREQERLDAEWVAAGGVTVDISEEGLNEQADKAQGMSGGRKTNPQESPSESVRAKAVSDAAMKAPGVAEGIARLFGYKDAKAAQDEIATKGVGVLDMARYTDPFGNISEALVREQLEKSGVDREAVADLAAKTGLAMGMVLPPGGGARKAGKVGQVASDAMKAGPQAMAGVNPSRLAGMAPDLQATIKNIAAHNATKMEQGVVGHAETIEKARGGITMAEALALDVEKYDMATLGTAVAGHFKDANAYYRDIAKRVAMGDQAAAADYWGAFAIFSDLAQKDALLGTQLGRGLEARKIALEELRGTSSTEDIQRLAETMAGGVGLGMDPATHARRMLALPARQQAKVAKDTINYWRAGQSAFLEAWINGLISGPMTHIANTGGSAVIAAFAPGERALAATWDFLLTGGGTLGERSVYFGEAPQMVYGWLGGMKDGLRLVGKQLREEAKLAKLGAPKFIADQGTVKMERADAITAQAFGMDPSTVWGGAVDFLGALVRTPGRALMTEDAMMKAVNYRAEVRALAYREASKEGLTGKAFWQRVREIERTPPTEVKDAADNFKLAQTLNREFADMGIIGEVGEAVSRGVSRVPIMRVVVPFTRTPTNSIHFASERFPILAQISDTNRRAIFHGTGAERAQALAKMTGGLGVAAVVTSYAAAPIDPESPTPYLNWVTGEGPKDKRMQAQLRAMGWEPYSIWNPATKQYVSYRRSDPLSTILGIAANYSEISGQLHEEANWELTAAIGIATQQAMLSKTFLTGLSDFLDTMEGDLGADAKKFFEGLARSAPPNTALVRQVMRGLDPIKKDVDSLFDHWRSGLPGYDAPAVSNLWGDEVMFEGGLGPDTISPYYTTTPKTPAEDPVGHWLVRNKVAITGAPKAIGAFTAGETPYIRHDEDKPIKLEKDERQRLRVLIGKGGEAPQDYGDLGQLAGQPTLKDAIASIIDNTSLTNGPAGTKADAIRARVNQRKQMAIQQLRREFPALDKELTRREKETQRKKIEDSVTNTANPAAGLGQLLKQIVR